MSSKRFVLLVSICCCFILCDCEDKNSDPKKKKISQSETAKPLKKTSAKEKKKQKDSLAKEPFRLTNKNVIEFLTEYGKKNPETLVRIKTSYGNIDILLHKKTPIHRANFIYLVKENYFDETFFYRVAKGFVIQGGNSDRTQMAQRRYEIGEYTLPQEPMKGVKHNRGAVALSKQWVDNPSNRSTPYEFFIVIAKQGAYHLDGEHTIFGKVVKGMHVADKISNVPVDGSEWPKENIFIKAEVIR